MQNPLLRESGQKGKLGAACRALAAAAVLATRQALAATAVLAARRTLAAATAPAAGNQGAVGCLRRRQHLAASVPGCCPVKAKQAPDGRP